MPASLRWLTTLIQLLGIAAIPCCTGHCGLATSIVAVDSSQTDLPSTTCLELLPSSTATVTMGANSDTFEMDMIASDVSDDEDMLFTRLSDGDDQAPSATASDAQSTSQVFSTEIGVFTTSHMQPLTTLENLSDMSTTAVDQEEQSFTTTDVGFVLESLTSTDNIMVMTDTLFSSISPVVTATASTSPAVMATASTSSASPVVMATASTSPAVTATASTSPAVMATASTSPVVMATASTSPAVMATASTSSASVMAIASTSSASPVIMAIASTSSASPVVIATASTSSASPAVMATVSISSASPVVIATASTSSASVMASASTSSASPAVMATASTSSASPVVIATASTSSALVMATASTSIASPVVIATASTSSASPAVMATVSTSSTSPAVMAIASTSSASSAVMATTSISPDLPFPTTRVSSIDSTSEVSFSLTSNIEQVLPSLIEPSVFGTSSSTLAGLPSSTTQPDLFTAVMPSTMPPEPSSLQSSLLSLLPSEISSITGEIPVQSASAIVTSPGLPSAEASVSLDASSSVFVPTISPTPVSTLSSLATISPTSVSTLSSLATISPTSVSTLSSLATISPTSSTNTNVTDAESFFDTIRRVLTLPGLIGLGVGAVIIFVLFFILCCCCCVGCRKSQSKKKVDFRNKGSYNYENPGAMEMYNGDVSAYRSYSHGSGLDLHTSHHYESAADVNTYLERGHDYGGGDHSQYHNSLHGSQPLPSFHHSQGHPSQPLQHSQPYPSLSHHHSQASALTDIFQKTTLPELSPMTYSLTGNPHHPDTLYLNTMPASDVSLREPTMFALRLQQEESKSAQGSRLSINGSKTSIHNSMHGSKPSVYGSRASNIHGSRPLVFNSGTSRESLLGLRGGGGKEHSIDDEAATLPHASQLSDRFPSPAFPVMNPSMENTDLPTRDSPLPRLEPLEMSHGKKDFASLTCITNDHRRNIPSTSPSPMESPVNSEVEVTPVHRKLSKRRDLSSLTSLDFMSGPSLGKENRGGTIIEEEEASQGSRVNSDKAKDESPAVKKRRSKRLSRLEKLTSLDYIRQSFRLKKKKVSFEQSQEDAPKPTGKKSSSSVKKHSDTVISNNQAQIHDNDPVAPEKPRGRMEWHQGRRNSSTSTDMFSPTENIARHMYLQHHHHAFQDPHAAMAMSYTPQLSQPTYFLPPHMSGAPGMPMHPHMYPPGVQLSQQFYPSQLSQGYPYHPPGSFMGEVYTNGRGFPQDMVPPTGSRADHRQEVVTPDYSDITTPDHEPGRRHKRSSIEEADHFAQRKDMRRYEDSTSPTNHTPDTDTEVGPDSSRLEYGSRDHPSSLHHYGNGFPGTTRPGRQLFPLHTGQGEGAGLSRYATPMSHIPQDMLQNSISVDDPPSTTHYHGNTRQDSAQASPQMERKSSDFSDTTEQYKRSRTSSSSGGGGKGRVSWHSTLATYSQDNTSPELSRL